MLPTMNPPTINLQAPSTSGESEAQFSHDRPQLEGLMHSVLAAAQALGASAAEAEFSESYGLQVGVRLGEVETIEHTRDKGLNITVFNGQRRGHASTSDLSPAAVQRTVEAAYAIACYTGEDPCAGLAEAELLAQPAAVAARLAQLSLFHPWALSVDEAVALGLSAEQAAMTADSRINNSEGASVSVQHGQFMYANSLGFMAGYPTSRHSLSCSVLAEDSEGMQRDYWWTQARAAADLESAQQVGRRAAERTVRRLSPRRVSTEQVPVLFDATVAGSLLGHWLQAVSGSSQYRRTSFLLDCVGQPVWAPCVSIVDDPDVVRGLGSGPFDQEGVCTQRRVVVEAGVQQALFLGSYSARKLGLRSTGNAGGAHNLLVSSTGQSLPELWRLMGRGLWVTELMGQGVNMVTGDYSRGAAGFWIENGELAYPVEEITIAGHLRDMFRQVVAIGNDALPHSSRQCGSILIERMTVAGE